MVISKKVVVFWVLLSVSGLNAAVAADFQPKYGPAEAPFATPLWSSADYFRNPRHTAPQFWSLISFYIPQFTHASCSVASVTMTLNAARTRLRQSSDDQVISEPKILDQVEKDHWKDRTATEAGYQGKHGMSLDLIGGITKEAFRLNGLPKMKVKTVHVDDLSDSTQKKILQDLNEFEKNPNIYLIANFDQKFFTNDMSVGHFAPVGAFDSENQKVLILDPDREYFSPYWISLKRFIEAMNTFDAGAGSKTHRGYISIIIDKD